MNDSDKIFGIPKSLAKIVGGLVLFLVITSLLSSQICILSTCTGGPIFTTEILIGGAVALILMSMFPISIGPALLSGLGVWFVLQNLGWFQML